MRIFLALNLAPAITPTVPRQQCHDNPDIEPLRSKARLAVQKGQGLVRRGCVSQILDGMVFRGVDQRQ